MPANRLIVPRPPMITTSSIGINATKMSRGTSGQRRPTSVARPSITTPRAVGSMPCLVATAASAATPTRPVATMSQAPRGPRGGRSQSARHQHSRGSDAAALAGSVLGGLAEAVRQPPCKRNPIVFPFRIGRARRAAAALSTARSHPRYPSPPGRQRLPNATHSGYPGHHPAEARPAPPCSVRGNQRASPGRTGPFRVPSPA